MSELVRIGTAATALGVSLDTLRRWERDGRIKFERRGQQRFIDAKVLAALLRERGGGERPGVVVSLEKDGVMAKEDMACGPFRIVSLMSREAADELELAPGVLATAVVKSTTVMVVRRERSRQRRTA